MTNEPEPAREIARDIDRIHERGGIAALTTLIAGSVGIGAKLLITDGGEVVGSLGDMTLDAAVRELVGRFLARRDEARVFNVPDFAPDLRVWADAKILLERIEPEPRIVICGAGHVGAALAQLASYVGYRVTLVDDRAEFVNRAQFPNENIELVAAADWGHAVRESIGNGHGVSVTIVTRGHNEDEECLRAVVTTNPDYIGLIGSKRRTNIVLDRMRELGTPEALLSKVHAPIGLDIGAVTPEEVALAILAEIVAQRRGGKGGSLSAWRRIGDS